MGQTDTHTDEQAHEHLEAMAKMRKALHAVTRKKQLMPMNFVELLRALGRRGKQELFEICSRIYVQWEWPQDFLDAIIIPWK